MPKTPKKTKEEKLAENYFPLDTGDIKKTVEKKVKEKDSSAKVKVEKKYKQIDISTLETVEKKSIKSKTAAKRKKPASL